MLDALQSPPAGVPEAAALIAGLDSCFLGGFARLGDAEEEALASLGRTFSGTPLADALRAAVSALAEGNYQDRHFAALAAARGALHGAMHDALVAQAAAALGRPAPAPHPPTSPAAAEPAAGAAAATWQESTRHWLMELALTGFGQLDAAAVVPFSATLEALQADPAMSRQAVLLTGLLGEIAGQLPIADPDDVPLRRWVDLWSRAMLGACGGEAPQTEEVAGNLKILGSTINTHAKAVRLEAWGLLEGGGDTRLVRACRTAWKVDQVFGDEVWVSLGTADDPLLRAISDRRVLRIKAGARLTPAGDLLLGQAQSDVSRTSFDWAAACAALAPGAATALPVAAPADRHPVQVAVPIFLEDFQAAAPGRGEPTLTAGGGTLPVERDRTNNSALIDALPGASALLGLLRFDGGRWSIQPLAVRQIIKGKQVDTFTGSGVAAQLAKSRGTNLAVLRERAGKLLRTKS